MRKKSKEDLEPHLNDKRHPKSPNHTQSFFLCSSRPHLSSIFPLYFHSFIQFTLTPKKFSHKHTLSLQWLQLQPPQPSHSSPPLNPLPHLPLHPPPASISPHSSAPAHSADLGSLQLTLCWLCRWRRR